MKTNLTLRFVGAFEPDHEELQNYAPELWSEDSLIHVYDTNNTHPEYNFVFIEELADTDHRITCNPFGGMFHVLVGNFSEVYGTLEEAEVSLKEQIGGTDAIL